MFSTIYLYIYVILDLQLIQQGYFPVFLKIYQNVLNNLFIYLWNSRSLVDLAGILSCAILLGSLIAVVYGKISPFFKKTKIENNNRKRTMVYFFKIKNMTTIFHIATNNQNQPQQSYSIRKVQGFQPFQFFLQKVGKFVNRFRIFFNYRIPPHDVGQS